ncbi:RAVE complex protein Rav1 C-terminal [Penicillium lagena]|uniref:RAVE complex protein Rav1 C-terminal n=1 Tax=Penicillium lagena TaxID=94218 RepID=UPI00253FBB62|nr:RAVE complex protein Rav1 C-terminal [Penicillium lagena]KAJ5618863.1 RAVE complex protein Rav1 C-terminal [Penicillium lagena]
MPPISSQRRVLTEENSSLSDDDVGFLYQVVIRAEGKPEVERLPFRALFEAYDEVIGEHGANADPGHACLRFLFKMGNKGVRGETLYDKFESALQQIGIVLELGDDGSTDLNETHAEDASYSATAAENHVVERDDYAPADNGIFPTPQRRASFNTTLDIGEDVTQRSFVNRPSSRSSMSRLEIGKPEFSKFKLSPKQTRDSMPPTSPDRTQLIAQFLEVGRRLMSRFDFAEKKDANKGLINGLEARSAVDHDRFKRMTAASQHRRSPSFGSLDSSASDEAESLMSHPVEHDDFEMEEAPPEFLYRPQLSDLLRDASTFNMYRQRAICRRILTLWLKRAFQAQQVRQNMESVAVHRDRGTLLRQAFDPWRGIIQHKRHTARTERFFRHLEERAGRARDLYLMTKAFTHWAQLTSEEVARTSAARRHVLGVKYFNAWREITAVNELKAQRFALQRPFNAWRKKIQDLEIAKSKAVAVHDKNLRSNAYWQWFWCFYETRAPVWHDHRLKRRALLYWLRNFRMNREREHEVIVQNRKLAQGWALQVWSQKSKRVASAQQEAELSQRYKALRDTFDEWQIQSRLAPAASRVSDMVSTRILRGALSHWVFKARMANQANEIDRFRVQRNAWTSWNDTLRSLALRARIDERLKMEAMYKWILMERFQLMQRIREQRIKREIFSRFVANTRDTYTRLLFHAEIHEDHHAEDLMRSKFAIWRDQMLLQREREYVAFEFYAPRLAEESLAVWRAKHAEVVKMEGWAKDARFYFLMKRLMKQWHQATRDSAKRRRQEAYAKIRRKIKINLASKAMDVWKSRTRLVMDMDQQAGEVDRAKMFHLGSDLFALWHEKSAKRVQECRDADIYYFRQVAFDQLMQLSETFVIHRELEDQADHFYRSRVLRYAGSSLRKLSLRVFQIKSTAETAEAMRERNLRKHSRGMFRYWVENMRLKLEARDSPGPALTPAQFSNFGDNDGAGSAALFDPWYQDQAETPFKLSDFTTTSQEPVSASASPLATPSYMNSPSKRAARARALAQMSTTPATPLRTPFASRLLRVNSAAAYTTSSRRPRTGRRNSIGTSVRFVDEELPESPTEGRRSANRRP